MKDGYGHYKLNKRHMLLSCGWHYGLSDNRNDIDEISQNNDVEYDNHQVKLLKDKQIINFSLRSEIYEEDED